MLQKTIASGIIAFLIAALMPIMPLKVRKWMLVLAGVCMCYLTLFRSNNSDHRLMLEPFWSYRKWSIADVRWQICMNIFLFVPYGALLRSLRVKNPLFVALLTSVLIELAQYIFKLGLCETDDVINNMLGAAIGCGLFVVAGRAFGKVKGEWESR